MNTVVLSYLFFHNLTDECKSEADNRYLECWPGCGFTSLFPVSDTGGGLHKRGLHDTGYRSVLCFFFFFSRDLLHLQMLEDSRLPIA